MVLFSIRESLFPRNVNFVAIIRETFSRESLLPKEQKVTFGATSKLLVQRANMQKYIHRKVKYTKRI